MSPIWWEVTRSGLRPAAPEKQSEKEGAGRAGQAGGRGGHGGQ